MERGKKIILGILVFLVTTIFYREFKLKTNEIKNIEIIENKEIVKNEIIQEEKTEEIDKNIVLEVETKKETETLVKLDKEISEKTVETILEDNDLENKIAKDWEDQENEELTDIDNNIDLEEKIVLENLEYTIKKGDTISDLSKEYKIKTDYIYANNVDKNLRILQVGKKINIPT